MFDVRLWRSVEVLVRGMQSQVEEIKGKLDIVDVVGTYVQLKRAGANFSARCPFHSEKSPSFMVSKPKQIFHCFGCGEGGDVIKFVMKMEGLEFIEALKLLADKAGVALSHFDTKAQSVRNILLDAVKAATDFFVQELSGSRGSIARDYMKRRGLNEAVIKEFQLGYAPDSWDALTRALKTKFSDDELFQAGVVIKKDQGGMYDRFRHRVMFPIRDVHGNPVGFTSRILDEKRQEGKYINTPETMIYSKGRMLYGLDMAREAIRKHDYAVLVEGNMDVITCHQFGMKNVVAASGTALTLDQVRLLMRYTNNIAISFDMDSAGETAAKRGIDVALKEGMRIKVITIPKGAGKDPDECIRKNKKAWEGALRGAKEIMEFYIEIAKNSCDLKVAHGRSRFVQITLGQIVKLPDQVQQDFWLTKVGDITGVDQRILREQMKRTTGVHTAGEGVRLPQTAQASDLETHSQKDLASERLLALMLEDCEIPKAVIPELLPEMLLQPLYRSLYTKFNTWYTTLNSNQKTPGSASADADLRLNWHTWCEQHAPDLLSTSDILELYADKEFQGWDHKQCLQEARFLLSSLRREYTKRRRTELGNAMRTAEAQGNTEQVARLAQEFELLHGEE